MTQRGRPAEVLAECAAAADVDPIVVSQRSGDGVTGAILGSTADRLARTADVPVTIVPASEEGDRSIAPYRIERRILPE